MELTLLWTSCLLMRGKRKVFEERPIMTWYLFLSFAKTLDWFWTIVTSFTQEELARLVQFITGSSQLPPGGFAELTPQIQTSTAPTKDALPTAHTWYVGLNASSLQSPLQ